jgi:hypothetical protein
LRYGRAAASNALSASTNASWRVATKIDGMAGEPAHASAP